MSKSRTLSANTDQLTAGDFALQKVTRPPTEAGLESLPHKGSLVAGGLLGLVALKKRGLLGLFGAGVAAGLVYRGAQQNGLLQGGWKRQFLHTRTRRLVPFQRQIIIDRPPDEVYRFWRNLENLAIFLPRIRDVKILDKTRSRWELKLADNFNLEWTARFIEEEPGRLLVWQVEEPSDLYHEGWISFESLREGRSTRMTVRLYILAPGGEAGARLMKWLESSPVRFFADDIQRFRKILESSSLEQLTADEASSP